MIEVAVILSAVDRHWPDFFIILVLWLAVLGNQTVATLIAVYGLFMSPWAGTGRCSSAAAHCCGSLSPTA
jgi:hypothetical protein